MKEINNIQFTHSKADHLFYDDEFDEWDEWVICNYDLNDSQNTTFGPIRNMSIWSSDLSRGAEVGFEEKMQWYNSDGVMAYEGDSNDAGIVTFPFYVNSTSVLTPADFTFSSTNPFLVKVDSFVLEKVVSNGTSDTQTFHLTVVPEDLAVGSTTINIMAGGR